LLGGLGGCAGLGRGKSHLRASYALGGHSSSPHSLCSRRSGVVRSSGFGAGWASLMLSNLFAHHRSHCDGRCPIDDGATGRRETMERSRRSFPTAAGWSFFQAPLRGFVGPKRAALLPSPSRSRIYPTSADLKCRTRASPSSGGEGAVTSTALAGPISRGQTAHLVPAARSCARGLQPCFAPNRGWAERRETFGCLRTRSARRRARRLASHNAGRSPLARLHKVVNRCS
jgi:hypothetical protein